MDPKRHTLLPPGKYIIAKARNLPIAECAINRDWQARRHANVIVAREHKSGALTIGIYSIDMNINGLEETSYEFGIQRGEYERIKEQTGSQTIITYEEAHNIIYGSIANAEDFARPPHKDFSVTQYILEEDSDEIEYIDYDFGTKRTRNIFSISFDAASEQHTLDKAYQYQYPDYPTQLKLVHPELHALFSHRNRASINEDTFKAILALPRETLVADISHSIYYEIGQTRSHIHTKWRESPHSFIIHALIILNELQAEEALPAILEIMRQNNEFAEFHLSDYAGEYIPLALYRTGRKQLPALLDFAHESGLHPFLKYNVYPAVAMVASHEPERRDEVLEWFRNSLTHLYENRLGTTACEARLTVELIAQDLVNIRAKELLPELRQLIDANLADKFIFASYAEIEKEIGKRPRRPPEYELKNPAQLYEILREWRAGA